MSEISTEELARMAEDKRHIEVELGTDENGELCWVETAESIARRKNRGEALTHELTPHPWMQWLGYE